MKRVGVLLLMLAFPLSTLAAPSPSVVVSPLPILSSAAVQEVKLPVPELETLPNGLQLVWFLSDKLPVADLALLVKSGYQDDPEGKSGTAELLSATLDRGADGMSAQQLAAMVESLGGSRYISADEESFTLGAHGLATDAPALLDYLAKVSILPEFPEAELKREHARLLDRWSHISDYAEGLVSLAYHRVIGSGTPYGRGNLLSVEQFKKVGRGDVLTFYKTHFTPKNSILMIVGRVSKKEFRERIVATFGKWRGEAPKRALKPFVDPRPAKLVGAGGKGKQASPNVVLIERPGLSQAQVRIGFEAPLITHPRHYPLVVANALLGEYFHSRLNTVIRDKLGLTYSIGSGFSYSKQFAKLTIGAATQNENAGKLVQETLRILRELKASPVTAEEVTTAKEYLVGGFPLGVATLGSVASRWLGGVIFDLGPNYLNEYVPKVSAVTAAQVNEAIQKDFNLNRLVIIVAGDPEPVGASLGKAKIGTVKRVRAKDLM